MGWPVGHRAESMPLFLIEGINSAKGQDLHISKVLSKG